MTYKQIEASREARLWISQVIVPVATAIVVTMSIPEVREKATSTVKSVKESIKKKFKKN